MLAPQELAGMTAMQLCLIHFVVVRIHTTNRPPPKNLASPSMFESECRKPEEKKLQDRQP